MKLFRFPYGGERTNRWISIIDSAIGILLVLFCCFSHVLGIQEYLQQRFGFEEIWADAAIVISIILLMYLEQFVTYHIDKRISK